jgi:hypothetical protein
MSFTVVSWYTPNYKECSDRLVESLERHGYTQHVEYPVVPVGRWAANVRHFKPVVLARALAEIEGDVLYLDADAIVHGKLPIFDDWAGADMAVHYKQDRELLGGTVYLHPSERLRFFLEDVAAFMEYSELVWQRAAQLRLVKHPEIEVLRLPPEYCCIFDSMRSENPGIIPLIEHMQQSRKAQH